jgi:acyl carrier protein
MNEDTVRTLREFMMQEFPLKAEAIASLSGDDPLGPLDVIDSLGLLTVATFVEEKWRVKVPPRDFSPKTFDTLNRIGELVENLLRAREKRG